MSEVFIVYTYNQNHCSGSREKVIGTYLCLEDIIQRVKYLAIHLTNIVPAFIIQKINSSPL